jgi:hypothetical protein
MRISRGWTSAVAIGATVLVVGCAKKTETASTDPDETTPGVAATEQPGTQSPTDIAPTTAQARVEELKVGPQIGADGAVTENKDDIKAGEPLYASISVEDIGVGSSVEAVWKGPDDAQISSEIKRVAMGSTYLTFKAPDTASWKPGDYKVEIRLGDEVGGSEGFEIEAAAG